MATAAVLLMKAESRATTGKITANWLTSEDPPSAETF